MKLNNEFKMSIQHVGDRKTREKLIYIKQKFAIPSLIHIFKLAIIITYIQYEVLHTNYQVLCRSRGVIYNKDGKFIYKPAKSSQGHIIVIEDRHPESSSRTSSPQQTSSPILAAPAYQPIQLLSPRAYQPGAGIEGAPSALSATRTAGLYSNGQVQLINLNDLQGLIAPPSHSYQANLARSASEVSSSNHYPLDSRLPPHQPIQIIPLIQLYHPSKYQTASLPPERPYSFINVPGSQSAAVNLGINQDYDRLHNDHNPILDNGASIMTSGQYSPAQSSYQQQQQQQSHHHHQQQHSSLGYSQNGAQGQLAIHLNNQQSTRPRSDLDQSMNDVFDNQPSSSLDDHQHERQALAESAFIDDPLTGFRNILPHSDENPLRPQVTSYSHVRPKMSGFLDPSSEHVDDISSGGPYVTSTSHHHHQQHPSKFNHLAEVTKNPNPKTTISNQDGPRSIFGRSALPSLININNLGDQSNSSLNHLNNSSKEHIIELEDRHKKSSLSNLETLSGKSKLLKNSKRNLRNKSKQLSSETRKIDNHYKQTPAPIDDDLNSKDLRGNQYWNQFKDQFEIM